MNKNDIISNTLPDENPATGTSTAITMNAIVWEIKKATYMLTELEPHFRTKPGQQYPDNQQLDDLRLNFERIGAGLDIINGILGRVYELATEQE